MAQQQGVGGVWFVGAYARLAVPLLENGVCAAVAVAAALGAPCPWDGNALPPAEEAEFAAAAAAKAKAKVARAGRLGGWVTGHLLGGGVLAAAALVVAARAAGLKIR